MEVAMKYQLKSLLDATESYVARHLTLDNCFPIYHEATRINANEIRELVIRFILHHWKVLGRCDSVLPGHMILMLMSRSKHLEHLPQHMLIELIRRSALQGNDDNEGK